MKLKVSFFIRRVRYEAFDSILQGLEPMDESQAWIQSLLEGASRTRFLMRIVKVLELCQARLESIAFLY